MARGVRGSSGSLTQTLEGIRARKAQLETEEKEAREAIRNALSARFLKAMDLSDDGLGMFEQLVLSIERSGLAAVVAGAAELPGRVTNGRGRGKDEGSGEKETGVDA